MALLTIRQMGDEILTKKCKPVKAINKRILQLADDMFETMYDAAGVGLAAPQVGVLKRMVVIDVTPDPEEGEELKEEDMLRFCMINPEIISADGEQTDYEGCLSYAGMSGIVTMEDLLEEIVGNIYDEFDPTAENEIQPLGENVWRVSGTADLEALEEIIGVKLPHDEDYDTLGGLVFSRFSTIPEDGSTPSLTLYATSDGEKPEEGTADQIRVDVEKIVDRRVEWARVTVLPAEAEKTEEDREI